MKGDPKVKVWMDLTRQYENNSRYAARQALRYLDEIAKSKQVKLKLTKEYRRLCELAGVAP